MKTAIKTMTKGKNVGQLHCNLTFWLRDSEGKLRGLWVSASSFAHGTSIVGIRMCPDHLYPIREIESGIVEGDAFTEYPTEFGVVKADIHNNRLFVKFPDEIVRNHEFPAQREIAQLV